MMFFYYEIYAEINAHSQENTKIGEICGLPLRAICIDMDSGILRDKSFTITTNKSTPSVDQNYW